jgi:hypothetical protein
MHREPDIQHKAASHGAPSDMGFDDAGERVRVVGFDYGAIDGEQADSNAGNRSSREAVIKFAQWTERGNASPEEIGRRVLTFLHIINPESTLQALGNRMGLDKSNASRRVREMHETLGSATQEN